jgi:hypothetical protein
MLCQRRTEHNGRRLEQLNLFRRKGGAGLESLERCDLQGGQACP